jgi:hypothetical protein
MAAQFGCGQREKSKTLEMLKNESTEEAEGEKGAAAMTNTPATVLRFLLFDGRAKFGSSEDANVMDTAASEAEAAASGNTVWQGSDAIWEEVEFKDGELHRIRLRWDLPPASRSR